MLRARTLNPVTSRAADEDAPAARAVEAGHQPQQRRLAGEGGTEKDVQRRRLQFDAGFMDVGLGADPPADGLQGERHRIATSNGGDRRAAIQASIRIAVALATCRPSRVRRHSTSSAVRAHSLVAR